MMAGRTGDVVGADSPSQRPGWEHSSSKPPNIAGQHTNISARIPCCPGADGCILIRTCRGTEVETLVLAIFTSAVNCAFLDLRTCC